MKQNVQNRIRKVSQPRDYNEANPPFAIVNDVPDEIAEQVEYRHPDDWTKGALLNVRNAGECYNVTLYPEESDPRYPERTLKFTNPAKCQDFVSKWYARESHNPLAR